MALKPGHGLTQWELATTRKLVTEFRRRSRRHEHLDFEDLVQECLLHWLDVRRKLDANPHNPPLAYMAQVLRNKLTDIARESTADKRSGDLGMVSLDVALDGSADGPTLGECLNESESVAVGEGSETSCDIRMDIIRALPLLTASQQRLCLLLGGEGLSIREAAERLQIPRGTLYDEIRRIRQVFAAQGLAIYLKD